MSVDCMINNLASYVQRQSACPQLPFDIIYQCLCSSHDFIFWYLGTLCINCNGGPTPLASLLILCPSDWAVIEATYLDTCTPYVQKGLSTLTTSTSSTIPPVGAAIPNSTSGSSLSSPGLNDRETSSHISSSGSLTSMTSTPSISTTVVLSMITPGLSSSAASKMSTVTASMDTVPVPSTHPYITPSNSTTLSTALSSAAQSSTSTPTPIFPPVTDTSSSGMSTGAKVGIGVGAAAAAVGIGMVFISLLTILRRRNSRLKPLSDERRDGTFVVPGIGGGGPSRTSTTLAQSYADDEPQFNRDFGASDCFSGNGLGISRVEKGPRETIGLVPSGRITQVIVGVGDEHTPSEVATPLHAEGVREIHHVNERSSEHAEEEEEDEVVAPRETQEVWHSLPAEQQVDRFSVLQQDNMRNQASEQANANESEHSMLQPEDGDQISAPELRGVEVPLCSTGPPANEMRYSTAQESAHPQQIPEVPDSMTQNSYHEPTEARLRRSIFAYESNYEAAMRPKSRIYSVVESPVLDLAQADLSREILERLEEEERRIDEAIRDSENRARLRAESQMTGIGRVL